jgi:hypothetical protein
MYTQQFYHLFANLLVIVMFFCMYYYYYLDVPGNYGHSAIKGAVFPHSSMDSRVNCTVVLKIPQCDVCASISDLVSALICWSHFYEM